MTNHDLFHQYHCSEEATITDVPSIWHSLPPHERKPCYSSSGST